MPNERIASLSKRATNMDHKIPYVDIISDAITESPYRRLTAKEIFDSVSAKYGPMKSAETLKNTIRHTLSRYKIFRKVQRGKQKKPNWWTIDDDHLNQGRQQIEELQEDISNDGSIEAVQDATPAVVNIEPQQNADTHHRQQQLDLTQGHIEYPMPAYKFQLPTVQYQQLYCHQMLQNQNGNGNVHVSSDGMMPGPSQASYDATGIGDSGQYTFQYQDMSTNQIMATGPSATYASPPPPNAPEYYQM